MNNDQDISFVVFSCDKYQDLWEIFFSSLDKYWPDCPYKVYLVSNFLEYPSKNVHSIKIGEDSDFGTNLAKIIEQIPTDWFVYWYEDTMFSETLDTELIKELFQEVKKRNAGSCLLIPTYPVAYCSDKDDLVGEIPKNVKYRAAIGASLYHKSTFKKLIMKGKNIWEHDINEAPDQWDDKFLALNSSHKKKYFPFAHAVVKGKWCFNFKYYLKKEGFEDCYKIRERESLISFLYQYIYGLRLSLLKFFKLHWYK